VPEPLAYSGADLRSLHAVLNEYSGQTIKFYAVAHGVISIGKDLIY
jgi:hypothetical protein